jgi:phosphomevalonate kinase
MTLEERRVYIAPNWRLAFEGIRSDIKDLAATNPEPGPSALGANQDQNGVKGALIPAAGAFNAASNQDSDSSDSVIEHNPRQVYLCLAYSQTMAPLL